mmetsp:Transcript_5441/g.10230  ORF Transcript_5441/g.10230 Transcript_5441/m.10230 type:complete len:173 (+) Transcript_5441:469-987(+)
MGNLWKPERFVSRIRASLEEALSTRGNMESGILCCMEGTIAKHGNRTIITATELLQALFSCFVKTGNDVMGRENPYKSSVGNEIVKYWLSFSFFQQLSSCTSPWRCFIQDGMVTRGSLVNRNGDLLLAGLVRSREELLAIVLSAVHSAFVGLAIYSIAGVDVCSSVPEMPSM